MVFILCVVGGVGGGGWGDHSYQNCTGLMVKLSTKLWASMKEILISKSTQLKQEKLMVFQIKPHCFI